MDSARARYLNDRVLTATPAQRVVMLFDRLVLDLTRAGAASAAEVRGHTGHASQIVAELFGSLDPAAGGPAENLAAIYGFLLKELMTVELARLVRGLPALIEISTTLRSAWVTVAEQTAPAATRAVGPADGRPARPALAGSWVG